MRGER
jgi:hypothetical protein